MTISNSSSSLLVPLNERQKQILKLIVEKYIVENTSISSLSLSKTNELKRWSSATIRNDMVVLEEKGLLKKEYFSSGKIPTKEGYRIYIESLMEKYQGDKEIEEKIVEIFSDRYASIEKTLDKCAKVFSEFLNLPTVLVRKHSPQNESLKRLDAVCLGINKYLIYLITSSGIIAQDIIIIDDLDWKKREDIIASVRLLNEKLFGCPLDLIHIKLRSILPMIRRQVHQYEFIYEIVIIQMIFRNLLNIPSVYPKIYNAKSLISIPELKREEVDAEIIFNLLENISPFSPINFNYLKTGRTLFNLDEKKGISVASADLDVNLTNLQLYVVGPFRMNYSLIKYLFDFLNEKLSV